MTRVRIDGVVKRFAESTALDGVSLELVPGELFTLLGPSGCGKTTLLRIVAGLLPQDAGSVAFDGVPVDAVPAYERNIGVVFQSYAIFPHLPVRENIAYGLRARGLPADAVTARVREAAHLVQLEPLLARMPAALSGGQQQRVVLARALVIEPRLLLMDEPLSNLDARLRRDMRALIRRIQRELGITTLYVTHDQEEALAISDTIAVMDRGRVLQTGRPWEVYLAPRSRFVAEFLGSMNVVPGRVLARAPGDAWVTVETACGAPWRILDGGRLPATGTVQLGVRPESLRLEPPAGSPETWNEARGTVTEVTYLGSVVRYQVRVADGLLLTAEAHDPDFTRLRAVGDPASLWCAADRIFFLPADS
ncbi:MAG TPA: ABC transporter ATP-binding protein [Methylomirabilota bacterium]|jgi:ABC-type Fe3+/spermidine/putrescine transport system ATPase subunit|nr:ABC transporter ATP-binding protein [Methylomirabilota bacterium]